MAAHPARARGSLALLFAALVATTALAYQPAWHGGFLWDDDGHVTRADLRSADGLRRIWFDVGATQQYYPLTHTAFWIMHRGFGDDPTGYHLVNIALHAVSALLIAVALRRLGVAGGVFAAFVFALHPVHVESIAWITELKNALSGVLYLSAALAYMRFDESRRSSAYALASALFVLALLAKTVTATLPVALLVVFWWKRGRLAWRSDVRPLVPWMFAAAAAGAGTAWVERTYIGASTAEFNLTVVERVLLAGRAVWFYLARLLWPADLVFIYPRWNVSQTVWWQYLFPAALVLTAVLLWRMRHRSRTPLAALAFFVVTLAPALGFVNVFPFRFSFVADHFQYLATVGPIAFVCAGMASAATALSASGTAVRRATAAAVAGVLGMLTWQQSHMYASAERLYRETLARNPSCWMAAHNLGLIELRRSPPDVAAATTLIRRSLAINPANAEAHNSLGLILQQQGQTDEARSHFEEAVRLAPKYAVARNSLGVAAHARGDYDRAIAEYTEALRLNPDYTEARRNMGVALVAAGHPDRALPFLERAASAADSTAAAHDSLGTALLQLGRGGDAILSYREALRREPASAQIHNNLGVALAGTGRLDEAIQEFREALRLGPKEARVLDNLGDALFRRGERTEAEARVREAIAADPDYPSSYIHLANVLHAAGRLPEAVTAYRHAIARGIDSASAHNDLGVALAGLGRMPEAIVEFRRALAIDPNLPDARANLARAGARRE